MIPNRPLTPAEEAAIIAHLWDRRGTTMNTEQETATLQRLATLATMEKALDDTRCFLVAIQRALESGRTSAAQVASGATRKHLAYRTAPTVQRTPTSGGGLDAPVVNPATVRGEKTRA